MFETEGILHEKYDIRFILPVPFRLAERFYPELAEEKRIRGKDGEVVIPLDSIIKGERGLKLDRQNLERYLEFTEDINEYTDDMDCRSYYCPADDDEMYGYWWERKESRLGCTKIGFIYGMTVVVGNENAACDEEGVCVTESNGMMEVYIQDYRVSVNGITYLDEFSAWDRVIMPAMDRHFLTYSSRDDINTINKSKKEGNTMEFMILSRSRAKKLSYKQLENTYAIISITDTGSQPVCFAANDNIKAIMHLDFDDVGREGPCAMTSEDADRVADFVERVNGSVDCLLVHCEAGVSRSAGVCAAVMKELTGDDMPVFGTAYYKPNFHCYRQVLEAFERKREKREAENSWTT